MAKFPKSAWLIFKSALRVLKLAARSLANFHFLGLVAILAPSPSQL
jgi:hypothetical protein